MRVHQPLLLPTLRHVLLSVLFAAAACLPLQAAAQALTPTVSAPSATLTLPQALLAARDNIEVSLGRRAVAAAQADVAAADHGPAPVLSVKASAIDLQNGIGGGNAWRDKRIDKGVGIDWTWERGDKRSHRTRAAQLGAVAAQLDLDETVLQQQLATHVAFYDLLTAQERATQFDAIHRNAQQLASTAARRVKAGDLSAQDGARTEIEAERARGDLLAATLEQQRSALALAQLTGSTGTGLAAHGEWPALPDAPPALPDAAALDRLIDARADVRAARQRQQAAEAALALAVAQKKPDITIGASLDHFPGTSNRLLELRLQMPLTGLGGSYNYEGEIARAQAQLDQANDLADKARRLAAMDLVRLHRELAGALARTQGQEHTILPRARQVAQMAELAYGKGAMSLTDLVEARRTLRNALLDALAARGDFVKAAGAWALRTPSL